MDYLQNYLKQKDQIHSKYQGAVIGDYQFDKQLMNSYNGKNLEEGNALLYKRAMHKKDKFLSDLHCYINSNTRVRISDPKFKGFFWSNQTEKEEPKKMVCCKNPDAYYNFFKNGDPNGDGMSCTHSIPDVNLCLFWWNLSYLRI